MKRRTSRLLHVSTTTLFVMFTGVPLFAGDVAYQQQIGNPKANWHLQVTTNHTDGVYKVGDALSLRVTAPRCCHVHILNVNPKGDIRVLWPIKAGDPNQVASEQTIVFPDPDWDSKVTFVAREPIGKELIVCLATDAPINLKQPDQARRFAEFLEGVASVSPAPLARLRSFVTRVEPKPDGWTATAISIETVRR